MTFDQHIRRTHQDTFPLQCEKCRSGFLNKKKHKNHSIRCEKQVYECYLCNKFQQTDSVERLKKHMTIKHTKKGFLCTFTGCNRAFRREITLRRHLNSIHGKSN